MARRTLSSTAPLLAATRSDGGGQSSHSTASRALGRSARSTTSSEQQRGSAPSSLVFASATGLDKLGVAAAAMRNGDGNGSEDNDDGGDDDRVIQVAIRCRGRRRRRDEQRAAHATGMLHRSDSEWMPRRRDEGIRSISDSCSSDSESDSDSLRRDSIGSSGGVIEFGVARRGRLANYKPSVSVQTHAQSGSKRRFEFNYVFPPSARQREVYEASVRQQVEHVLRAHERMCAPTHATIVAYGQTGTGKTYTMGMLTSVHDDDERGIIPRAVMQIMEYAERWNSSARGAATAASQRLHQHQRRRAFDSSDGADVVVSMSYLQIYLETIQDLLVFPVDNTSGSATTSTTGVAAVAGSSRTPRQGRTGDLQVRQKQNQTFYVEDLSEYEVSSLDDVHVLLETATRNRVLASTARNKTSSRSHTLLTISLKWSSRWRRRHRHASADGYTSSSSSSNSSLSGRSSGSDDSESDESSEDAAYTISFVDLAGSERVDGALHFLNTTRRRQELRIREAKFINRSLSALGSVIAALAQPMSAQSKRQRASATVAALQSKRVGAALAHPQAPQPQQQQSQQRHIRFRDSQLTKLLQSRLLRGSGRLLLIATIDDQRANVAETLSTLKFASQCRRVELRSPRSAAARRKDSLLEQVFREMKTTYEEREAALHREYQDRVAALEQQIQLITNESDEATRQCDATQLVAYTALCALADQTLSAHQQPRHPSITSFRSKQEMTAYVKAMSEHISTAIQANTGAASVRVHPEHRKLGDSVDSQQKPQQPPRSSTSESRVSEPAAAPSSVLASPQTQTVNAGADRHEKRQQRIDSRGLQPIKLLPEHEREFSAVAHWLLEIPDRLRAFHVDDSNSEPLDLSFSQIDSENSLA